MDRYCDEWQKDETINDGAGTTRENSRTQNAMCSREKSRTYQGFDEAPGGVEPPVISGLTATPGSGAPPMSVAFAVQGDNLEEEGSVYAWDFGDGTGTSTEFAPTYEYTVDGTYDVSVTVTNEAGTDTFTEVGAVVVTTP